MSELAYTPLEEIEKAHRELRKGFESGKLKSIAYRKYQLLQLGYLVQDNAKRFEEALASDLGRPALEAKFLEIGATIGEAKTCYDNVEKWAKPESPPFSLNFTPMRPVIRKEAKGVVLIISPFNYPLWLTLSPAAGAIAAGNAICLKPSEQSPAVSSLLAELIPKYLDNDLIRVVNGGIPESTKILELQWDHILYTGGYRVAKIVSAAAAKHLTPVSLELGGKSPVVIDPGCDLQMAARRILWGKFVNAGQTCVAPDYVLVPRDFQDKFIEALKETYEPSCLLLVS
jgi:aldehyde dehydrogenase (NAD+)